MPQALILFLRSIKRSKISFIINIIGLSAGLACAFLIYLWVSDEMSVDKFHENDDRLYQVLIRHQSNDGLEVAEMIPGVIADDLAEKIPEIEAAVAVVNSIGMNTLSIDKEAIKAKGIYAGEHFFDLFSFDLVEGHEESVLSDINSMVISEELAFKIFGARQNVVGRYIEFDRNEQFLISGVAKVPANSSLQFDFVLPIPVYTRHTGYDISWDESNAFTHILLKNGSDIAQLNNKFKAWLKGVGGDPEEVEVFARKFSDGYLYGYYENGIQSGGRIDYLKTFSIIGIIILLIACINFMNLSTAMASNRMKEVGVKKVLGANRKSIIIQHLSESISLAFLSLFLSLLLVFLLLPSFNELAEKQMELNFNVSIVVAFFTITLFTGILSGIYPAFYVSGFKPVSILKDNLANTIAGQWIRNGLIVTQFAISVILIMATLVVYNQFEMIQNRNLGYNKDNILYFDINGKVSGQREAFLAELRKISGVQQATSIYSITNSAFFGGEFGSTGHLNWPGKAPNASISMNYRMVDFGVIEMLDMEMKEGRSFSREFGGDSRGIIFNEAAIKLMGLENPVGTNIELWQDDYEIIGVVKDFYFQSINEGSVKPLFIIQDTRRLNTIMVKVNSEGLDETSNAIEEYHSQFNPGFPFNYKFLDQDFQNMYSSEKRLSVLSRYFAGMAILISCLGIFGLTAFTVNKRKKEISIRKVLGSSGWQTILLLYKDFSTLVLIALLIGLPVGYVLASNWLEGYAVRIDMEPWFFMVAGGLSFVLMLIASGFQIIKILSINPAESLRKE